MIPHQRHSTVRYHSVMNPPTAASTTATELAWIDGEIMPSREAKVPFQDRGFFFAEAAYEVCVGRGGRTFAWDEHRARLERTLKGIAIPEVPATLARADEAATKLVAAFGSGSFLLYLHVTGGVAPRLHVLPKDPVPAVYGFVRAHDRAKVVREQARGFTAITRPDIRWRGATYKTTQLLPNILAKKESRAAGVDDVILVAADGVVLEGAATNLFWVEKGRVCTCPLSRNILPGITREVLIRRLRVPVTEVEADVARVVAADEVFMSGTTHDATAVVRIDDRTIRDGRPGPVTLDLGRRLAELFDQDCPER
jgi:D-alanine transaminase